MINSPAVYPCNALSHTHGCAVVSMAMGSCAAALSSQPTSTLAALLYPAPGGKFYGSTTSSYDLLDGCPTT